MNMKEESEKILKLMNDLSDMLNINDIPCGRTINAMSNIILDLSVRMGIPKEFLLRKMGEGYDIIQELIKKEGEGDSCT